VKVNGQLANPATGTTNWSSPIVLKQGINTIEARADDAAGNSSPVATIQINYQPSGPVNDFFALPVQLTGSSGVSVITNTTATKEFGEPNHAGVEGGASLWWTFAPPDDGVLTLSTTNSDFDTLLAVYTGNRVNALTEIASNDDAFDGSGFSQVELGVKVNQIYHIAIDGFGGASGVATWNIR